MKPSSLDEVRRMYEETADSYAQMMDAEINLPIYAEVLGRLRDRIADTAGTVVDTACGSGHMLSLYHQQFDQKHPLLGVDLSPRMVSIAEMKLGSAGRVIVGDMRELPSVESGSSCAVLNFFALHHLDFEGAGAAFKEWSRILAPGGQLVVAAWEGCGAIDYGEKSDIVALRYESSDLKKWAQEAGFRITRCIVEQVEDFPMDAVYLEAVLDPE